MPCVNDPVHTRIYPPLSNSAIDLGKFPYVVLSPLLLSIVFTGMCCTGSPLRLGCPTRRGLLSSGSARGLSLWPLLGAEHRLLRHEASAVWLMGAVVVAVGLSCSSADGVFPDQGQNAWASLFGPQILKYWHYRSPVTPLVHSQLLKSILESIDKIYAAILLKITFVLLINVHCMWQTTENILDVCNHFSVVEIIHIWFWGGAYFYFTWMLLLTLISFSKISSYLGQNVDILLFPFVCYLSSSSSTTSLKLVYPLTRIFHG